MRGGLVCRVLGAVCALSVGAASAMAMPVIDHASIARRHFGNDAPWYLGNIPFFEASDPALEDVYYYRWKLFRAHQRDVGAPGYVTTEFLDDVPWQRMPYATMNDSAPFHIAEARWLADRRYVADYLHYLYEAGGNDRHFSESIADAAWGSYLVDGDRAAITRHLPAMRRIYAAWADRFDDARGLYWIPPVDDATEYTVASIDASGGVDGFHGGDAYRPSMNAYMFANALAIARLSQLSGDRETARAFAARAATLRKRVHAALWNETLGHFGDRHRATNAHVSAWQPTGARELVGFVPWAFGLPYDTPALAEAWSRIIDPEFFAAAAGLRTVEPNYRHFMRQFRYDKQSGAPECQWNGPIWPFQTTQVLSAMARLLRDYSYSPVSRTDWNKIFFDYAKLHRLNGALNIQENYHPDTGRPIVGLQRSHHYYHSGFNDLVITGLVGLRPRDDAVIEVDPLALADGKYGLRWFALEGVRYRGRTVSVHFDADGTRYRRGAGFSLSIDGREVARAKDLRALRAPFVAGRAEPIEAPINLAVQLQRDGLPRVTASVEADREGLHEAVDGRLWFFPEMVNGWSVPKGNDAWITLDFKRAIRTSAAELAFYQDGPTSAPPERYRIQRRVSNGWVDIDVAAWPVALGNGITRVEWQPVSTNEIRLLVTARPDRGLRLIEMKVF